MNTSRLEEAEFIYHPSGRSAKVTLGKGENRKVKAIDVALEQVKNIIIIMM